MKKKKVAPKKRSNEEILKEYNFPEFMKLELPMLVLGIVVNHDFPLDYKATKDWNFLKLQHQTSGHACNRVYVYGLPLTPREPVKIKLISDGWLDSDMGCFGKPLDEVLKYREQIKVLFDVDCNYTYEHLEEGIYPIDYSRENLDKMATHIDGIPENPDELLVWESKLSALFGCINRWHIFILGENCD